MTFQQHMASTLRTSLQYTTPIGQNPTTATAINCVTSFFIVPLSSPTCCARIFFISWTKSSRSRSLLLRIRCSCLFTASNSKSSVRSWWPSACNSLRCSRSSAQLGHGRPKDCSWWSFRRRTVATSPVKASWSSELRPFKRCTWENERGQCQDRCKQKSEIFVN